MIEYFIGNKFTKILQNLQKDFYNKVKIINDKTNNKWSIIWEEKLNVIC